MATAIKSPSKTKKQTGKVLRASRKITGSKKQNQFTELKLKVVPILKPYASRISVFGSFARGEATSTSDIDLLIALKPAEARPALGLIKFISLEQALEKKLGREVDLITEEEINTRRKQNIEKDRVILYESR
ncbi:MAG: nucleotidyltransferase domain-containing protein [Anaerolineales bacterium]|nr:nucleotidyltransferase domain-containing protein [Anaerolineales bacterium]